MASVAPELLSQMQTLELASININLLVALDSLLSEQNVTRAAKRIGISQSAMSHNLATLRTLLGDPLLQRVGAEMQPTARAIEIARPLRRALHKLHAAIQPNPVFDAPTSKRRFRIAAPDFITASFASELTAQVMRTAPAVELTIRPMDWKRTPELLDDPDMDVVIGPRITSDVIRQRPLFQESFVCVVRKQHALARGPLSIEDYAKAKHLVVSPTGSGSSSVDHELEHHGVSRQIVLRVPSFLAAPLIISQSELVLTALRSSVESLAEPLGLKLLSAPFHVDTINVMLSWHIRNDEEQGHQWLRQRVEQSVLAVRERLRDSGASS